MIESESFIRASGMDSKGFPNNWIFSNDCNLAIKLGKAFNLFPSNHKDFKDLFELILKLIICGFD